MNKDQIIKNAKKLFRGNLLQIVLKQINTFFEIYNSNYSIKSNYNIGDEVILNNNHLLHGIGKHTDIIDIIKKRGIISLDYLDSNSNHAFSYVSAFWKVDNEIKLKDYIKNYSGMVVKYNDIYEQVPYGKLDLFVEKMKEVDHWLWTSVSSMEIRFMPSLAKNINQIGFILNINNDLGNKLRNNKVFTSNFSLKDNFKFVSKNAKNKFKKEGFIEDFFLRAEYIIFGIPSNFIEGVLVGREFEKDKEKLVEIKTLFKNAYICNLDGKVIL